MADLETAIRLATEAHRGQRTRGGQPYILHPLRVMFRVAGAQARMVAVLHDVLEDTPATRASLAAEGFPAEVVTAVDCLTRREGETYEAFIERVQQDPLATRVKLADLEDNMNIRRLPKLAAGDRQRLSRYHRAWRALRAATAAAPGDRPHDGP